MKALELLQDIKRSVTAKGYVDFNLSQKAEKYTESANRHFFYFNDGSVIVWDRPVQQYRAVKDFKNKDSVIETFQY